MRDNSNFFELLQYTNAGLLDVYDEECALREIDYYMSFGNENNFNVVNYERLIYIEFRFADNEVIQNKLLTLKTQLCNNYILRHKLLKRLTLTDHDTPN